MNQSIPPSPSPPAPIDWENVYRQLRATQRRLEEGEAPSPAASQAIFQERAAALARAEPKSSPQAQGEIVVFRLAHETYAVESQWVLEIYPLRELITLPGVPPTIAGIIHLRGRILAIVNLKQLFDLPGAGLTDQNKVVVLSSGPMEFGILADEVSGVRRIRPEEIHPPPPTLSGSQAAYLKGTIANRLILLDAGKLLADPALIVQEEELTG